MCFEVPGRIVELRPGHDIAEADILGVPKSINVALLAVSRSGAGTGFWCTWGSRWPGSTRPRRSGCWRSSR
jgi:hypothetical protein